MQFTPDRAKQIVDLLKTETRRPVHRGDSLCTDQIMIPQVLRANGNVRYYVGQYHAVQPGRGKPTLWWQSTYFPSHPVIVGGMLLDAYISKYGDGYKKHLIDVGYISARIKILEIWREDVLNISLQDSIAEGFKDREGFWQAWIMMYDRVGRRQIVGNQPRPTIEKMIAQVPVVLRMAWALRFELVKG